MVDSFLRWWLRTGRYVWSRLHRRLFERRYLKVTLPAVSSLEEIETSLKQVTWTMDGPLHLFDCISYPQATWAAKKDDCDGFAVLAAELLQRWQPETNPVLITAMLRPMRNSHTVCGFYAPERLLCFFDNSSLRRGNCKSYSDIVALLKGNSTLVCWDVRNPNTLELYEFHKM